MVLCFPDVILRAFYGDDFVFALRSLQILVLSQIINVAFGPVGLVLTLCGFERKALAGQAVGLFVSVVVSLMLVDTWGAVGAAIGVLTGLLVWNVWMAVQVKQHWGGPHFLAERSRFIMIISDKEKFVFVHIPKCAGTSVRSRIEHLDDRSGAYSGRLEQHPELGLLNYVHLPLQTLSDHFPAEFECIKSYRSLAVLGIPRNASPLQLRSIATGIQTLTSAATVVRRSRQLCKGARCASGL